MKLHEKDKRIRFVRALEKIANRARSSLKKPDFDKDLFDKQLAKQVQIFSKIEPVFLDSSYTKDLLAFVNACTNKANKHEYLLKMANKLGQLKAQKSYKKAKHKKSLND